MRSVELAPAGSAQPSGKEPDDQRSVPARRGRRRWGHRIALALFATAVVVTLIPVWAAYIPFDPAVIRLSPATHPMYLMVLMVHIVGATVALVTSGLQVWPWLRRRHPRVHRYTGRVYIFGGVYPAAVTVLVLTAIWPFSMLMAFNHTVIALFWLTVTTYGLVLIRRRRIADHRRWMLRSYAVTASVLLMEALDLPVRLLLMTQFESRLAGSEDVLDQMTFATENWMGFTLAFIFVEWWLEREQLRRSARQPS